MSVLTVRYLGESGRVLADLDQPGYPVKEGGEIR